MIELKKLSAGYGRTRVLEDVSLTVEPGAVYALLGRNGTGKTTAVRCLLGLARPVSGSAFLCGLDSWSRRAEAMAKVGVVAEAPDAPPSMSAAQLAAFSKKIHPRFDRAAFDARVARLGLPADAPFGALSRGQKAQVALALAICAAPEVLVLDDPTLGLDPIARRELLAELVGALAERGTTTFVTTHDLAGVERIASHVGMLRGGRLVLDGELDSMKSTFRQVRFPKGAEVDLAPFRSLGVRRGPFGVEAVLARYEEEPFEAWRRSAGVEADVTAMSLEEIFAAVAAEGAPA